MTAELLDNREASTENLEALTGIIDEQPEEPEETTVVKTKERSPEEIAYQRVKRQRTILNDIYGTSAVERRSISELSEREGIELLNQAARMHLQATPAETRPQVLTSLDIVKAFIGGKPYTDQAKEQKQSVTSVVNQSRDVCKEMGDTVFIAQRAGQAVLTPRTLIEQKVARAETEAERRKLEGGADWILQGLCGIDPDLFYAYKEDRVRIQFAKSLCGRCAVREQCLIQELSTKDVAPGIVAGLTERERRKLKKR